MLRPFEIGVMERKPTSARGAKLTLSDAEAELCGCAVSQVPTPRILASDARAIVDAYHRETKHRLQGYAPSPGFLDWDSQPDPFRRFEGAPVIPLPLGRGEGSCRYDDLYAWAGEPAAITRDSLGLFFELSLGLSAWKSAGPDRWALRNNPSSGNLHPTEGYLLVWRAPDKGVAPGLYHYASHDHALERRAVLPPDVAARLAATMPGSFGALGLSSVIWREEWKYGARAFRYCQHDVGHALGAARFAARVAGWRLWVDPRPGDAQVAACLGLDRTADFAGAEPEHPDLVAVLADSDVAAVPDWSALAAALGDWTGQANRLSQERVRWPQIARVLPAVAKAEVAAPAMSWTEPPFAPPGPARALDAATVIRRRRSAQRMDGCSAMSFADFERAMARTLPSRSRAPFDALPFSPALNLLLFVHAVERVPPGLYLLSRTTERFAALREACAAPGLDFARLTNTDLPLYRLRGGDERRLASTLCCHQGIAGRGALSVGMIADLARVLEEEGPFAYRRLHWEAGVIGQILYLEAEAAGLRGTGIGCFFDDEVHDLLGLRAEGGWQTLYHFTVGGAMADERLGLEPAYAHLADRTSAES